MHKELKRGNLLLYFSNILRLPSDRKTTCGEHTMSKCTPQYVEVYTSQMKGQRDTNCDSPPPPSPPPTPPPPPPFSHSLFEYEHAVRSPLIYHTSSRPLQMCHTSPRKAEQRGHSAVTTAHAAFCRKTYPTDDTRCPQCR